MDEGCWVLIKADWLLFVLSGPEVSDIFGMVSDTSGSLGIHTAEI